MTCKDCIHNDICEKLRPIEYCMDITCSHFKNKADVVEVKHGYWKDKFNRNRMATQTFCSVCGKHSGIGGIESNRHKPYCPNCGTKMDGERKCDNG